MQEKIYEKQGPEVTLRSGVLSVAIWANPVVNQQGQEDAYRTVTIERRYKDKKTGQWQSTHSLRANDVPKVSLLLSKAYERLILQTSLSEE